jgi:hypothetical protein
MLQLSEYTSGLSFILSRGRAVAQAVSRWLPTAAARVRVRAACGVRGEQSSTGAGFFRVLRFPLANHHSTNFYIIIIIRDWHNGPIGGRSAEWTHLDSINPTPECKKEKLSGKYVFIFIS